jgi:hypothetical protein
VWVWVAAVSQVRLWYKGAYLDRDPNDPKHWIVDQRSLQSVMLRQPVRGVGLMLRAVSYQPSDPTPIPAVHVRQGCVYWTNTVVDQCTNCGGQVCTSVHDTYRPISPNGNGFRLRCSTDTCIYYDPNGTPHNCSWTHSEIHVDFNNGCVV